MSVNIITGRKNRHRTANETSCNITTVIGKACIA